MGPVSGYLSDRFGARVFSTSGMLLQVAGFLALTTLPADFPYPVFAVLIFSLAFYALLPYRRRAYVPILVATAAGFALGQLWDFLGLPSFRLGQANLLPAVAFALLLQPLARFVPRPSREDKAPKDAKETAPPPET